MKTPNVMCRSLIVGTTLCSLAFFTGCESTSSSSQSSSSSGSEGVHYRKTERIEKVWIADGFDFAGYDTIYVAPPTSEAAKPKDEKEEDQFERAMAYLPGHMKEALDFKKVVPRVVTKESDIPAGAKVLELDTTIYEFHRGSTTESIFLGIYGGGRGKVLARGRLVDKATGKPVILFDDKSDGEMFSGTSSQSSNDAIVKLSEDWARLMSHLVRHEPIDYKD